MKRAVICTNQTRGGTPIFRGAATGGEVTFQPGGTQDPTTFIVDFSQEYITGIWGHRTPMTPKEAAKFGADFGLWFES